MRRIAALVLLATATALPCAASVERVVFPDGTTLDLDSPIGLPPGSRLFALSADGRLGAYDTPDGVETVRFDVSPPRLLRIDIDGEIRALAWSGFDDPTLWVVRHRPAKRRDGDTELLRVELERGRAVRLRRLPDATAGLIWWPIERSLLVLAGSSLRSVRLEGTTSGPMYRLAGQLTAATVLDGSRLLVAEAERVTVVDLSDPPGPDSMPVREALPLATPLTGLAPAVDGASALAIAEDRSVWRVRLEPLRLEPLPNRGVLAVTVPGPAVALRESRRIPDVATTPESPLAEPPASVAPEPAVTERTEPPPPPIPIDNPATPPPAGTQLAGRVGGPAAVAVAAVVLLGPDSLLREAARIAPGADGRWSVGGLAPGRYRVVLAAADGDVLVSEPPFAVVQVEISTEPVVVPPLRALRRLE